MSAEHLLLGDEDNGVQEAPEHLAGSPNSFMVPFSSTEIQAETSHSVVKLQTPSSPALSDQVGPNPALEPLHPTEALSISLSPFEVTKEAREDVTSSSTSSSCPSSSVQLKSDHISCEPPQALKRETHSEKNELSLDAAGLQDDLRRLFQNHCCFPLTELEIQESLPSYLPSLVSEALQHLCLPKEQPNGRHPSDTIRSCSYPSHPSSDTTNAQISLAWRVPMTLASRPVLTHSDPSPSISQTACFRSHPNRSLIHPVSLPSTPLQPRNMPRPQATPTFTPASSTRASAQGSETKNRASASVETNFPTSSSSSLSAVNRSLDSNQSSNMVFNNGHGPGSSNHLMKGRTSAALRKRLRSRTSLHKQFRDNTTTNNTSSLNTPTGTPLLQTGSFSNPSIPSATGPRAPSNSGKISSSCDLFLSVLFSLSLLYTLFAN